MMNGMEHEIVVLREMHFRPVMDDIEKVMSQLAGGTKTTDYYSLQRYIKEKLNIPTIKADWRTRKGIILWFCVNWEIIFEKYIKERLTETGEVNMDIVKNDISLYPKVSRGCVLLKEPLPNGQKRKGGRPKGSKRNGPNSLENSVQKVEQTASIFEEVFIPPTNDENDITF